MCRAHQPSFTRFSLQSFPRELEENARRRERTRRLLAREDFPHAKRKHAHGTGQEPAEAGEWDIHGLREAVGNAPNEHAETRRVRAAAQHRARDPERTAKGVRGTGRRGAGGRGPEPAWRPQRPAHSRTLQKRDTVLRLACVSARARARAAVRLLEDCAVLVCL